MVRVMTGVGVEPCVAMTGEVTLSGAISGVSGLEGKLRYAHSSPRIKVVVLPRDNLAEATALVHKYSLNSVRLLPVSHMQQVIRLLFLGSVGAIGGTSSPQGVVGSC
jgi:ATP-dependent Lon protease